MSVMLTTPESYPDSVEARIVAIGANVENRTLAVVLRYGRVVDGQFIAAREITYSFDMNTTPTFIDVINAVPEFRNLRKALETYLVGLGRLSGTVN